jgi:FkbM family methyltransferase
MGGGQFVCDLRDRISREVCFTGRYEPGETAILQAILQPGMCFVDVGANWGYFTLLAAHYVGKRGHVISLEPDPRLFARLAESIRRNRLTQTMPLQVAAASEPGKLLLTGYDEAGGNFGLSRITGAPADGQTFEVNAESLDRLLTKLKVPAVDLLKMDIEGFESHALRGLADYLSSHRIKRLLLELHPAQLAELGRSAQEVIVKLYRYGYQPYLIDHSPAAFHRAAYSKHIKLADIIRPFEPHVALDAWPHLLWLAPGVARSW